MAGDAASATLLAGASSSAGVYASRDGGVTWTRSRKPPTGDSSTYLAVPAGFPQSGRAYAATSGSDSAVSVTTDGGATWSQSGLIDNQVSAIVDLAPFPTAAAEGLFMLTFGAGHSLWRTSDSIHWERVFSSSLPGVDEIRRVRLANETLYLSGTSDGRATIWVSTNGGRDFAARAALAPDGGGPFDIDAWAAAGNGSLFIGSFDGEKGLVYRSGNGGYSFSKGTPLGNFAPAAIALSPGYDRDRTVLASDLGGQVYRSTDNGSTFQPLGDPLPQLISGGETMSTVVAFDPAYGRNGAVYAGRHVRKGSNHASAIYRLVTGAGRTWERIDSLPDGAIVDSLTISPGGTLYAVNSKAGGGLERSINPAYPLGPAFETVTRGLDAAATLSGLWSSNEQLWSVGTGGNRLMTFRDSLSREVALTSPAERASGLGAVIDSYVSNVVLDWETLPGATSYQWQLDPDAEFSNVAEGFEGDTAASYALMPALRPGITYHWRVRAKTPVLGRWSEKRSFTTRLDTEIVALRLNSPEAGAFGVPVRPVFQWSAVSGAESYEFVVSTRPDFSNPSIIKAGDYALSTTAWQADVSLNPDTVYYWRIRALGNNSHSAWSAVSAFTTAPEPSPKAASAPPPPPPAAPAPQQPQQPQVIVVPQSPAQPPPLPPAPPPPQTAADWQLYLFGGLLLAIIVLAMAVLVLAASIRRMS